MDLVVLYILSSESLILADTLAGCLTCGVNV